MSLFREILSVIFGDPELAFKLDPVPGFELEPCEPVTEGVFETEAEATESSKCISVETAYWYAHYELDRRGMISLVPEQKTFLADWQVRHESFPAKPFVGLIEAIIGTSSKRNLQYMLTSLQGRRRQYWVKIVGGQIEAVYKLG